MRSRALLAAGCGVALLPLPALAAAAPRDVVLEDVAGDANGLNDQGSERLVGDVVVPGASSPEADLLRVRLAAVPACWSVALRVSGQVAPDSRTGEQLEYGLVAQPTPDCRFVVTFRTDGAGGGSAAYSDSGGCGDGPAMVELPSRVAGSVAQVQLPYRLLPSAVQPGAQLRDVQAYSRLVPQGTGAVGELDNVRGEDFRLPPGAART